MKRVLFVAYHFPPISGSSGVQRTLRFVRDLPQFGWEPLVLTCAPMAYEAVSPDMLGDVPPNVIVARAPALDAARHLSLRGRYPAWIARPDRWISWLPAAVLAGTRLIRKHRPVALVSTYPIATAHRIGAVLARRTGVPWVADFRDPMAQNGYPRDPAKWQAYKRIEEDAFERAAACTFTTPSAARTYASRYPASRTRIELIENGYDEESFVAALGDQAGPDATVRAGSATLTLLHSGIVYPDERDPTEFFRALARLKSDGIGPRELRVRFRAAVHGDLLATLAEREGVTDMIDIAPPIPYREALREMSRVDGLLLMQGRSCNAQIPAKLYEYLRAMRPIVALTDPEGDTAAVLRSSGIERVAMLEDAGQIHALLRAFAAGERDAFLASPAAIRAASRQGRARQLASLLDDITAPPPRSGLNPEPGEPEPASR